MKCIAALGFLLALLPLSASAICVVEPLEPDLRSADVVYVGTIIGSELVDDLPLVKAAVRPRDRRVELRHTLQPEIKLKGDPSLAPTVLSGWQYNPPTSETVVKFAELVALMPGDTLLVVAHAGEPVRVGLCTATRKWNAETAKVTHAVFPPAP